MNLPDIRSIPDLKGKRVLLRVQLNVPTKDEKIADDFRLKSIIPTITFLQEKGARTIMIGHIGREPERTLLPVFEYFKKTLKLTFIRDVIGPTAKDASSSMEDGEIILLENLRQKDGEYTNDESFSRRLASFADIYVNEAFPDSHREHASIVGIPKYLPTFVGLEFKNEVENLGTALNPPHPSLFILGGAKFKTKEPLIRKFLNVYDKVFVGGALANDFFKMKGLNIGTSLTSPEDPDFGDIIDHPNLVLPEDVVVLNSSGREAKKITEVGDNDAILDAGPVTTEKLIALANESSFLLWNGPLGDYEKGFNEHTEEFARSVAECRDGCIVGGGDTIASISKLGLEKKFRFMSTAGGAMLHFLLEGTLPGIEALTQKKMDTNES